MSHNPLAEHSIALDLLPGATHWFESKGELICSAIWENPVIAFVTMLQIPGGYHSSQIFIQHVRCGMQAM